MSELTDIKFGEFVGLVQRLRHVDIEDAVELVFSSDYSNVSGLLELDRAPENDLETRVIQAIFRREEMVMLVLLESVDATRVPELLDQILENLVVMLLGGMPMTEAQAENIFGRMHGSNLEDLTVYLRKEYCQGVVRALVSFLNSSCAVEYLVLAAISDDADDWDVTEENFQSLCAGIVGSSVKSMAIDGLRVRGHRTIEIHEILANKLIENSSSSIKTIEVDNHHPGDFSVQSLSRAISQSPAIRKSEMSFRSKYSNEDKHDSLVLNRHPWWKRHLGDMDYVPTKLLPLVLEKADTWTFDTSHGHLDVLFFLLKEKSS